MTEDAENTKVTKATQSKTANSMAGSKTCRKTSRNSFSHLAKQPKPRRSLNPIRDIQGPYQAWQL